MNGDFGVRSGVETRMVEVMGPMLEARHALSHLGRWMKPRRRSTELLFLGNRAWVSHQPGRGGRHHRHLELPAVP